MPTIDSFVIDPSGTTASSYTSVAALYTALDAGYNYNLIATDKRVDLLVKGPIPVSDSNFLGGDSGKFSSDSTHYVTVKAFPGHQHLGVFDSRKAGFRSTTNLSSCLSSTDLPYLHIGPGLCFEIDSSGVGYPVFGCINYEPADYSPLYVDGCVFKVNYSANGFAPAIRFGGASDGSVITNCVGFCSSGPSNASHFLAFSSEDSTRICTARFNTWINFSTQTNTVRGGFYAATGTLNTNCNYLGAPTGSNMNCYVTGFDGVLNKGARDATYNTEAVTVALRNIAVNDANFVNPAFSTFDPHLAKYSLLRYAGITTAGVTTDYENHIRGPNPDIGADEFYAPPETRALPPPRVSQERNIFLNQFRRKA